MTASTSIHPTKSKSLRIRLSDGEFNCMCNAAIEKGMDKSAWLLGEAVGPVSPDIGDDPLEAARRARDEVDHACDQIARIVNNCAQLDRVQLAVVQKYPEVANTFSALGSLQDAAQHAKREYSQLVAALDKECAKIEDHRTVSFHMRIAPVKKEVIKNRAATQGMTLSSFLRSVIRIGGRFPSPLDRVEIRDGYLRACCAVRGLERDARVLNNLVHEVNRRMYGGDAMLAPIAKAIDEHKLLFTYMCACLDSAYYDDEPCIERGGCDADA